MSWVVEVLPKTNLMHVRVRVLRMCVRVRVFCWVEGEEEGANQGGLSIRKGGSSGMDVRSLLYSVAWASQHSSLSCKMEIMLPHFRGLLWWETMWAGAAA